MTKDDICSFVTHYIDEFFEYHSKDYDMAIKDAHQSYSLSASRHTDERLRIVEDVVDCLEEEISKIRDIRPLIPCVFPSIDALRMGIRNFSLYLNERIIEIREKYDCESSPLFHVSNILNICNELALFSEEVLRITDELDLPISYTVLRKSLFEGDIDSFVNNVNSVLASIPYTCIKQDLNESYFHICLHLLLTLLGFTIISEDTTSLGRIDATLRLGNCVFLFEFKYSDIGQDLSQVAIEQIVAKHYAEKYIMSAAVIKAIGLSFSGKTRSIIGHEERIIKEDTL